MTDTVSIFVPSDDVLPLDELFELSANEAIDAEETDGKLRHARITWDDVVMTIVIPDWQEQREQVDTFQEHVNALLGKRDDKRASKTRRRAERMTQEIRCTVEPDWDAGRKAQLLIQGIMEYYDYALLLANNAIYNENGNIEVGPPDSKLKYWAVVQEEIETGEALERKKRSLAILKNESVPSIQHLPVVPDSEQAQFRSAADTIQRAAALYFISKRAEGEAFESFQQWIEKYHLRDAVTPQEWAFAQDDQPQDYMLLRHSQRLESCWTLLWAAGFVHQLKRPDTFCNEEHAASIILSHSSEQLLLEAKLRSADEILDALDLHYRYHWAIVNAELYGKNPPRHLEPAVVYERHYALNWLVSHNGEAWDDVTTNT